MDRNVCEEQTILLFKHRQVSSEVINEVVEQI